MDEVGAFQAHSDLRCVQPIARETLPLVHCVVICSRDLDPSCIFIGVFPMPLPLVAADALPGAVCHPLSPLSSLPCPSSHCQGRWLDTCCSRGSGRRRKSFQPPHLHASNHIIRIKWTCHTSHHTGFHMFIPCLVHLPSSWYHKLHAPRSNTDRGEQDGIPGLSRDKKKPYTIQQILQ